MPSSTAPSAQTDRIEKQVTLDASRTRVWRALTDVSQFNSWFGLRLTAPFTPGVAVSGRMASPKYEHLTVTLWIETLQPERLFSFRWHPYAIDPDTDYSDEPTTLVTFTLEDAAGGTKLSIVESGFDAIPESRRSKAFAMNTNGWNGQAENLRKYLAAENGA
jgi:uncharacterized protein YndB with AHSA1/START domain